jgi:hypothetical protein
LWAHYTTTTEIETAYFDFLKLKIAPAQNTIREVIKNDPENHLAVYIENYADFFTLLIEENKSDYNRLKNNESIRLKKLKNGDKNTPYYYFSQAEIKLHWAIIKFKFGDELSATLNMWQAWQLLDDCLKNYPNFIPAQKSFGILHLLLSNVPENYQWVLRLAGINPNFNKGYALLQNAMNTASFYQNEAILSGVFIDTYIFKKDKEAITTLEPLFKKEEDNLLYRFLMAQLLIKNKKNDEAIGLLTNIPNKKAYLPFNYIYFKIADSYLYKNDYPTAKRYYQYFLEHYKGENYLKAAHYKTGLTEYLSGNEATGKEYLNQLKNIGKKTTEEDKMAENHAFKGKFPHKTLITSRLYFDGGYYQEALNSLQSFKPDQSTFEEKAEYYYRKARILELINKTNQAKKEYKNIISNYSDINEYFAPNSALQLGYIYTNEDSLDLAEYYFKKAFSYKKHVYKNSIDAKAKAALNALKTKKN